MQYEYRTCKGTLRALEPPDNAAQELRFGGYAAMYNSLSEDLGGFREQIAPGAFAAALAGGEDVRALMNHDPNYVLGRTRSGTLALSEDGEGLKFEVTAPDTGWARDLYRSVQRGDIDQCSFGFHCKRDAWTDGADGDTRTLLEVELFDVSIVTFPAYAATSASVRSAGDVYAAHARDEPAHGHSVPTGVRKRALELKTKEW